jgi:hypothetical protein
MFGVCFEGVKGEKNIFLVCDHGWLLQIEITHKMKKLVLLNSLFVLGGGLSAVYVVPPDTPFIPFVGLFGTSLILLNLLWISRIRVPRSGTDAKSSSQRSWFGAVALVVLVLDVLLTRVCRG